MTSGSRLAFVADVHVPRAVVHALSGSGFEISFAPDDTDDRTVLATAADESGVLSTNDRDFAVLHDSVDHDGIIVYTTPPSSAAEVLRGIRRINRQFTPETIRNTLLWLEGWL